MVGIVGLTAIVVAGTVGVGVLVGVAVFPTGKVAIAPGVSVGRGVKVTGESDGSSSASRSSSIASRISGNSGARGASSSKTP